MLHSSIRLIETFGLVQTMQSLLSVVKKWFCVALLNLPHLETIIGIDFDAYFALFLKNS